MIRMTASDMRSSRKQTSKGRDGSETNSSIPQGTIWERRSASAAASRSERRSMKVELMKMRTCKNDSSTYHRGKGDRRSSDAARKSRVPEIVREEISELKFDF